VLFDALDDVELHRLALKELDPRALVPFSNFRNVKASSNLARRGLFVGKLERHRLGGKLSNVACAVVRHQLARVQNFDWRFPKRCLDIGKHLGIKAWPVRVLVKVNLEKCFLDLLQRSGHHLFHKRAHIALNNPHALNPKG